MINQIINNYKILEVLGEGGMGIVYKAFDLKLERFVALKVLSGQALSNSRFIERFRIEARNQAKLIHTNIIPVFSFIEEEGIYAIVMEFVDGITLEQLIAKKGRLTIDEATTIMLDILEGVSYAHKKGFIHRDLKPSNIIINRENIIKIMDFGISKSIYENKGLTKTGTKLGTLLYMSPEQIKAVEPTKQSDIYSLGVIFYEMLSGKNPFESGTDFDIMEAHLKKYPSKLSSIRKDVSIEIDKIVFRALHKTAAKRYMDCREFINDLKRATSSGIPISRVSEEVLPKESNIINRVKIYIVIAFLVLILGFLVFAVYSLTNKYWQKPAAGTQDSTVTYNQKNPFADKWESILVDPRNNINCAAFGANYIVAASNNGKILKSSDNGKIWTTVFQKADVSFKKIIYINGKFIAIGDKGNIYYGNPDNTTWVNAASQTSEALFDIVFLNNDIGFIVGGSGTILKTYDGGVSWFKVTSPSEELFYSICFLDNNIGFISGQNGTILQTKDGGLNWKAINKFTDKYLKKIYPLNNRTILCGGGNGELWISKDQGENWKKINTNTSNGINSIFFVNESKGYVSASNIIYKTTDAGENWNVSFYNNSGAINSITLNNKILYSTADNGSILMLK